MTEPYLTRLQTRMSRGESLEEAGAHYGLPLWRAKATFVRAGLPVPRPLRHRVPATPEERALGVRIHDYLGREDSASSTEVAAALRSTRLEVLKAVWPVDRPRLKPAIRPLQRYPREAILIGLKAMSVTRGQETGARGPVAVPITYWDSRRDADALPASPTVRARFGSWHAACEAAGIPVRAPVTGTTKRWTDEQCEAAVREFFVGGHGWASGAYAAWAQGRDVPSVQTVLLRLGSWPALRERLLA